MASRPADANETPPRLGSAGLRPVRGFTLGLLVLLLAQGTAFAQSSFGRWSWDGSLRAARRERSSGLGGERVGEFGEDSLKLALGVDGFVLHPNLARFRVGFEGDLSDFSGGRARDSRRWGAEGRLQLLPAGPYRLTLSASRQSYDYTALSDEDPLTLRTLPDTSSSFGARLRVHAGRLRGVTASLTRSRLSFDDETVDPERRARDRIGWAAAGRRFKRRLRLERRARDYGTSGLSSEDLDLAYEQLDRPDRSWRWDMSNFGFRREIGSTDLRSAFYSLQTRHSLYHRRPDRDAVELRYTGGFNRGTSEVHSHALLARYRWRARPLVEVAPFVGYGLQLSEGASLRSPSAGVLAVWRRPEGTWDLQLNTSAGFALRQRSGDVKAADDSALVLGLIGSAGRGEQSTGLRVQLDTEWNRNQLRSAGDVLTELPDLGTSVSGLGSQDSLRSRLTLRRRWGRLSTAVYSELARRVSSSGEADRFSVTSAKHSVRLVLSSLTLAADRTSATVGSSGGDQSVDVASASLAWRPFRRLSLMGLYREDRRQVQIGPDIEVRRVEASGELLVGAIVATGRVFRVDDRSPAGPGRSSTGFEVALSRRFAAWLPFVSGRPGGGVIK